jgi:hypothetical protein
VSFSGRVSIGVGNLRPFPLSSEMGLPSGAATTLCSTTSVLSGTDGMSSVRHNRRSIASRSEPKQSGEAGCWAELWTRPENLRVSRSLAHRLPPLSHSGRRSAGQRHYDDFVNICPLDPSKPRSEIRPSRGCARITNWAFWTHGANPENALAEAFRVLRPGGRIAFTVWATPDKAVGFAMVLKAIEANGRLDVPLPQGPRFFRFSDWHNPNAR